MARKSVKGLPKSVQDLARRGERYRLPGTWLYNTPRDRVIAAWLDEMAGKPDVSVTELVKDYLYKLATNGARSQTDQPDYEVILNAIRHVGDQVNSLKSYIGNGGILPDDQRAAVENADAVINTLLSFED
jgi:hypothetical protein